MGWRVQALYFLGRTATKGTTKQIKEGGGDARRPNTASRRYETMCEYCIGIWNRERRGKRTVNVDNRHDGNWMESLLASGVRKLLGTERQMDIKEVVIMCR
jgi:hypothetical protein